MGKDIVAWAGGGSWEPDPDPTPPAPTPSDKDKQKEEKPQKPSDPTKNGAGPVPRSGLVLGRFLPPHLGHQHLLDFARASVQHLTVIVFARSTDPIPGTQRAAWLRELAPGAHVMVALDEDGPAPGAPDYAKRWTNLLRRYVPEGPAYFFASDDHGFRLAEHLGATYVPVDPHRTAVPISATEIRRDPLASWRFLPACVRPWYAKRVAIVGAEGSGKTTLARALAARLDTVWVPEYARTFVEDRKRKFTADELPLIARSQAASEDALLRQANRVLVCDTDVPTVRLWGERLFGTAPEWIGEGRRYDLTLLLPSDNPFRDRIANAVRSSGRRLVEVVGEESALAAVQSMLSGS